MANEKRLIDAEALKRAFRTEKGAYALRHCISNLFSLDKIVDEAPTVDAVEVSRLGKLGRLMMPYKGCPRGRIGAYGAVGGNTTVTEIHITELDAIVDVEGDRWIPVLAEDLEKLKARANNAVEVAHGRWEEWWPGISLIMTGEEMLFRCSACDAKYADVEGYKFCPNCGAKMVRERP